MTFTPLHTYKCVDGRTARIVSPMDDVNIMTDEEVSN